jgi:hypothetical protein
MIAIQKHYSLIDATITFTKLVNYLANLECHRKINHFVRYHGRPIDEGNLISVVKTEADTLMKDSNLMLKYVEEILDLSKDVRSMDSSNFIISDDKRNIATKDFRVIIHNPEGVIPNSELLHCASICLLTLLRLIPEPICYDHIRTFLSRYGYTSFEYNLNGYIHVTVGKGLKSDLNANYAVKKDMRNSEL